MWEKGHLKQLYNSNIKLEKKKGYEYFHKALYIPKYVCICVCVCV